MSKLRTFLDVAGIGSVLSASEHTALSEVEPIVMEYLNQRRAFDGVTLGSHVLSALIDDGKIEGHRMGGDALALYSSDLASGLTKLQKHLPGPVHPLVPAEIE